MKQWQMPYGVFIHADHVKVVDIYIIDNYLCIGLLYTYSVRLLRCSFYIGGQCEGLEKQDE